MVSYPDEINIVIVVALGWSEVDAAGRKLVLDVVDNAWVVEVGKYCQQASSVPVIGDAAAIVTLTCQVRDRVVRNLLILVDEYLQTKHETRHT